MVFLKSAAVPNWRASKRLFQDAFGFCNSKDLQMKKGEDLISSFCCFEREK